MEKTLLIVGLGNPGKQYENTRHNAGFMAVDKLAGELGVNWAAWQGNKAEYAKAKIDDVNIFLLKPLTFMNLSGVAVSAFANFFKIPKQNILIIFDDMALPLGKIRLRKNGSAGGQNGMKNIIEQLGTQDIMRLRIGIGPKPEFFDGRDFVLAKFSKADKELLDAALARAITAVKDIAATTFDIAANHANQ
ncbi:MAG: aminoacyl-tRNA hydrolase [Elusimicrobiota bacterium]|jgi:PTH1 family peptidyl-tRNA hydrolase|nr:aminoacyl-tRNA hydrolase [Elusimicrobiota bacterium]